MSELADELRALALLEAEPKVVAFACEGGDVTLTLSFRGCDDDAFEIKADLSTVKFWFPKASA